MRPLPQLSFAEAVPGVVLDRCDPMVGDLPPGPCGQLTLAPSGLD
jgi:hypothetical protein